MVSTFSGERPLSDPEGPLEQAFIDEFLRARGHDSTTLERLDEDSRTHLLQEASSYAAGRLAEFESRARFVHHLHGEA